MSIEATVVVIPDGKHDDRVAGPQGPGGDRAGVAAVVAVLGALWPDDVLHREPRRHLACLGDLDGLEVLEQRRPGVPRHQTGRFDDVLSGECGDRDDCHGAAIDAERLGVVEEAVADFGEPLLVVADEIHLVDGEDEPRGAQQGSDQGVPAGLLDDAVSSVDEDDRQVGAAMHP